MRSNQGDASAAFGYAAPDEFGAPLSPLEALAGQERRRRGALLRIISLGVLIPVVLLIPTALIPTLDKVTLIALLLAFIGTFAAFLLNQAEQIGAGSFALLAGLSAAVAWEIVAKAQAQHGIDLSDLRLYDLFILPIVVSSVLLGRRGPLIFGSGAALFTIVSLLTLPHTPELQLYWDGHYKDAILGSVYDVLAVPIAIQVLASIGAWLGADSVRRALLEASRADDLSAANAQIQAQSRSLEQQRYRLQQGIAQLQGVHAAVARGQWDARASIADGELLPVALSLNLLLDRISRMTRESDQRMRIDAASHELAIALRRLRAGETYTPPNYTGTPFDEVLIELSRLRSLPAPNSGRTTGYDLGGQSAPPRSLPAPASQPERPFPFGRPASHVDPAAYGNPPTPSSSFSGDFDPAMQPGRMSLPPVFNQMQPPLAQPPAQLGRLTLPPEAVSPTERPPLPPTTPLAGRLSLPPTPPQPSVPLGSSHLEGPSEEWPDLAQAPAPERGPASTALPAWLQAQASAAQEGADAFAASNAVPPSELPPWLREQSVAGSAEPEQRDNDEAATPNYLPPWLQNIQ